MSTKKRVAAILITTVAISSGTVGVASADSKSKTNRISVAGQAVKGPRGFDLAATLAALVAKGTITQSQADAIVKAQTDAMAVGKAAMDKNRAAGLAVITSTLGITEEALKTRMKAGDSLATIAGANKDALIAALVAFKTKVISDAQAAGKITAERAAKMKANVTTQVTENVNNPRPPRGPKGQPAPAGTSLRS